jgi:hypothetical protein
MKAAILAMLLPLFVCAVSAEETNAAVASIPNNTVPAPTVTNWAALIVPPLIAGFCTLCGVAFGVGWSAWRDDRKEKKRIQQTVDQIREELRANSQMLPLKRKVLEEIVAKLKMKQVLPGESVRFLRSFYAEHFAAMCPYLSERERNSLHVIYEHLRVVDETMCSYESEMKSVMLTSFDSPSRPHIVNAFTSLQLGKMEDLLGELSVTEHLMQKHLAGEPEAVFAVQATGQAGTK